MQTVTLPKFDFDVMERELDEFRQDAEAKAEVIVENLYHGLITELNYYKQQEVKLCPVPVITYKEVYGTKRYDTEYHMDNFKANNMVYTYNRDFLYKLLDKVKGAENNFELGQQDSMRYHQDLIEAIQSECDRLRIVASTNIKTASVYGWGWFVAGVLGVVSHFIW